ncbi:MAG: addiction module protein [Candidatus Heimdallarchaeota archaeon]|nr:addiction module protein [Candidatus Heimdallarchaeota archaeon]
MTTTTENVLKKALELPPIDRALLVEHLLTSFELPQRKLIDDLWAKESEDRIDAYDKGLIPSTPVNDVFNKIK